MKKPLTAPELTVRAMVLAVAGSVLIAGSSTYVALRIGALPWPTIFVAVLSMAVLRPLGASLREINVAHTGMSAGGLVAGGLAFTLPGVWMSDPGSNLGVGNAVVVALVGTVLGVAFTGLLRRHFVQDLDLPFPMGVAAARTLQAGDRGGRKAGILFASCGFSGILTWLRDASGIIPPILGRGPLFSVWVSPMALGIGFIIGPLYMGSWALGAVAAHWFLVPIGLSSGFFPDGATAEAFRGSLGIGVIVGAGVAVLFRGAARSFFQSLSSSRENLRMVAMVAAVSALVLTFGAGIPLVPSLLATAGVWVTVVMAATITGQTGIDPMEIFGILVLLAIRTFWHIGGQEAFLVTAVVAVATGLAGDAMQDFRAGSILGTDPRAQLASEAAGGIAGAIAATLTVFLLREAFGAMGPGTDLTAPQAFAVKSMIDGLPDRGAFLAGLAGGSILSLMGVPCMTVGIGIYLPVAISLAAGAGGLFRALSDRFFPRGEEGLALVASGFLGGEGIAGVLFAIWKVLTLG
ncbi:MAG: OPT/YSL family transporter [Thermovirgaceae bacterium]|nr:OPT/YSL family transporter [Synergistales bacterium]MDI9391785.1 OPT/YSL family transporter [Synergistota bacterium]MDY0178696.1 OPT/YSL family transporter [Synergistaceae bacterium]HRW86824.1 OPT/YSL family transporter [Thermovirgaceae bacterium]MDD3133009.1 OPT/YSL family transporter [Synergistales bacterium]